MCEKDYIWNPATCSCENGKYVGSIIDDSVIMHDEIINMTKTVPSKITSTKTVQTNFNNNKKKIACKTRQFYILRTFLLLTIALLIVVSIYFYLIKYQAKQKHLLPYHVTNKKIRISFIAIMYYKNGK